MWVHVSFYRPRRKAGEKTPLTWAAQAAGLLICWLILLAFPSYESAASRNPRIDVSADPEFSGSPGRLLIFIKRKTRSDEQAPSEVDIDILQPNPTTIVLSEDVLSIGRGRSIRLDAAQSAPIAFSALAVGDYWVQAVLDGNRNYARYGRGGGDIISPVESLRIPLQDLHSIRLVHRLPEEDPWQPANTSLTKKEQLSKIRERVVDFRAPSPALSAFSKRSISINAWVLLPPSYSSVSSGVWPTVYILGAYGSHHLDRNDVGLIALLAQLTDSNALPPFIWVFPDYAVNSGVTDFLDSSSDGPWGRAFTQEFIPALEKQFQVDARRAARFLWGHSSGGWASVWLQLNHPDLFGGAWATAPDSCDFHDFVGANLYKKNENLYYDEEGTARPIVRQKGAVTATLRDWVHIEDVLGVDGGVFRSYDWTFSPKSRDGRPQLMFDHKTGRIHSDVVKYWGDHFDIGRLVAALPADTKDKLQGTLHVYVGTEDTHYLEGSVRYLKAAMDKAGLNGEIAFIPGRNHNNLYKQGEDPLGLLKAFTAQMAGIAQQDLPR